MEMPVKIGYFAYPYTDDPTRRCEEIKKLIQELVMVRQDFIPIVPHFAFDFLFDFPPGYSHLFVLDWELEILERIDFICFPPTPTPTESAGVAWESAIARRIELPVLKWADLFKREISLEELIDAANS